MKANFIYTLLFISISIIPTLNLLREDDDIEREDAIYLKSNINEVFASTEVTQYFINHLENPIELIISFPIKNEISLNKFKIKIGEKKVTSKVMLKQEAEVKYDNSIFEGNTGFLSRYDSEEKVYSINIGNISPKEKVELKSYFIQNIGTQDMSYEFIIMEKYPTFHYKELNKEKARNKIIKAKFIIETQSKITRLIAPFFDEMAKKKSTYEVIFDYDYKKAEIYYTKNPDDQPNKNIIDDRYGKEAGYPGKVNQPTFLTSFSLLFRTIDINKPILYYQFNPELNETSYSINYVYSSEKLRNIPIPKIPDQDNTISYYKKYENDIIDETPGLFIFLVDQSGSMYGKSIDLVKKGLLLFIQSLPPKSYFQFIGFGSNFKKYNEKPVEYNKENVDNIINIINNMDADMGGTNINDPLNSIYNDKSYSKINLSKNIFLLTDGQVNDREGCINIITANSDKFRLHSFGIGNMFDKYFIERSGKLGKGSSFFIQDVEGINTYIIKALRKCIRSYLVDVQFNFENYHNNINNNIISCKPDNIYNQDEIINFSFILSEKYNINLDKLTEPISIEITAKNPINLIIENMEFKKYENIIRFPDGDELSKMIVGKALKNNKNLIDDKNKEIEFSIKYQILSKNTALFAEIINYDKNQNKLITVNLNNYIEEKIDYYTYQYKMPSGVYSASPIVNVQPAASPRQFRYVEYGSIGRAQKIEGGATKLETENLCYNCKIPERNYRNSDSSFIIDNKVTKPEKKDITKLIISQNIIEGNWDENEETKILLNIIDKDKINKIITKIKSLNKGVENEKKIKYTILVIYYLNTEYSDKIDDYILVINKGKKYLFSQGIKYEDIIDGI